LTLLEKSDFILAIREFSLFESKRAQQRWTKKPPKKNFLKKKGKKKALSEDPFFTLAQKKKS
jgi:hypothetical protein